MTEKRFTLKHINEQYLSANLYDDKTFIASIGIGAELIVELLNSLNDENVKLRARNKYLATKIQRERNIHVKEHEKWEEEIQKENEQLKQFKEDVFAKIDMHLRMLPTAVDNEFNEEDGDPSLYTGAIYMLETLKKELKNK